MPILAVDTTTRTCSVAVVSRSRLLFEMTTDNDETHTLHLMGMVDQALVQAGISLDALDGFAVTRGPGSFTGLRIGLSSVKGLSMATGKPIVPVSSLEVLAVQARSISNASDLIVSVIDAYRREVFLAGYRFQDNQMIEVMGETVIKPDQVAELTTGVPGNVIFVGNGAVAYREKLAGRLKPGAHIRFAPDNLHVIRAATVGEIGLDRLDTGGMTAADIMPVYLRKSDAQIHLASSTR
ncbi:MAG: tRNA (adenosine(37)-N6)-threonylcarbamoyltransferase complex dimerization subunit type 1 TsaB [Deltaproteobacteria bacterium]|nr:MAG: tRNA (adenosine(37)-N6)-threonylcarbamoyltransferase complex dimerization subunit type 1 TsaB [Deltaproteobacteria bacterium]